MSGLVKILTFNYIYYTIYWIKFGKEKSGSTGVSVLNTSGKYDEDGTYNGISNGAFGIGGKLTNFLSKSFGS